MGETQEKESGMYLTTCPVPKDLQLFQALSSHGGE